MPAATMDSTQDYIDAIRGLVFAQLESVVEHYRPYESGSEKHAAWLYPDYLAQHTDEIRYLLRELLETVGDRDFDRSATIASDLYELSASDDLARQDTFLSIQETLELCATEHAELLYVSPEPEIQLLELTRAVDARLIDLLRKNPDLLTKIDPAAFEELIAELFAKNGFEVHLTSKTRDGGKDIIAFQETMSVRTKYLIECKRYAQNRKVSLDVVQRMYGVKFAENANVGIVVTTSTFTKDASSFANAHKWDIQLKDSNDIISWLNC